MRASTTLAALTLTTLLPGCGGGAEPAPEDELSREQFVDAVVAIRSAEHAVENTDSADLKFQARRDSILESMGIVQADLDRFLERHTNLTYMDAVWDTITQRLKRPLDEVGADARRLEGLGPEDGK